MSFCLAQIIKTQTWFKPSANLVCGQKLKRDRRESVSSRLAKACLEVYKQTNQTLFFYREVCGLRVWRLAQETSPWALHFNAIGP